MARMNNNEKNKSVYITAMEYGHNHFFRGITYSELKEFVEKTHQKKFNYYSEMAFIVWFLDSFSSVNTPQGSKTSNVTSISLCLRNKHLQYNNDLSAHEKYYENFIREFKFFLTGESDRKYLEYQELQEARANARQAFIISMFAIGISVIAMFFSPILDYYFTLLFFNE